MPRRTSTNSNLAQAFGRRLRQLREAEGWSAAELGKRAKASAPMISRWENAVSWPSAVDLENLAAVFSIEPWELLQPPGASPKARTRGEDPVVREAVGTICQALGIRSL